MVELLGTDCLSPSTHLEEETEVGAETPLERARRAVWGMFYADDAGVVSRSQEGLARMMTTIVEVFGEFGLTVSEKKTETLLMRAPEKQPKKGGSSPPTLVIEATGQKYAQTTQFRYLGGLVNEDGELTQERPTTGAEQRGHASGGSPGSSSTGREHHGDSRFDC